MREGEGHDLLMPCTRDMTWRSQQFGIVGSVGIVGIIVTLGQTNPAYT